MKKLSMVSVLLSFVFSIGCNNLNNYWQDDNQVQNDVYLLTKITTCILLNETKMSEEDLSQLKTYLFTIQEVFLNEDNPNFSEARNLVITTVPSKYQIYLLSIIDLIERYTGALDINLTNRQQYVIDLIKRAVEGAIYGLENC